MKTEMILAAALLVGFAFVPAAAAGDVPEWCEAEEDETILEKGDIYVSENGIFEESNGLDGLQEDSGTCVNPADEEETFDYSADDRIL